MKVTPLGASLGVAGADVVPTRTIGKIERAKSIAAGQEPQALGDPQAERAQASLKTIKMKTQVSTNRDDTPIVTDEVPTVDNNEPAEVVEETKPLSPQFAALARQKRALQVKEREIAQREEALKAQPPAGTDFEAQLKANPLSVLKSAGVTYDQLTEAILAEQAAPLDTQKLRAEIKEDLKKELLGEFGTRDQQAEAQVLGEIKREALALTAQGEQFEAIQLARAQNHPDFSNGRDPVTDLIHKTWKKTGEIMDVSTAAEMVETQLIEESAPFASLKKIQSRLNPAPTPVEQTAPKPGVKVMRTLTNRDNASPVMDRRARAIAAMNGTLKRG